MSKTTIPWDRVKLPTHQDYHNLKRENKVKEAVKNSHSTFYKPYKPIRNRIKGDCSKIYKDIYNKWQDGLSDPKTKSLSAIKITKAFEAIAGRKLVKKELENIVRICQKDNSRWKITKTGELYTTKEVNNAWNDELWGGNDWENK